LHALNYKFKFTFSSASISSVLLPAAQMRNTNPNFSLYRAFHSDSSCKIDHMQMTKLHSSTVNIAVETFLWPHVCCPIQSPILLMDKWFLTSSTIIIQPIDNSKPWCRSNQWGCFSIQYLTHVILSTLIAEGSYKVGLGVEGRKGRHRLWVRIPPTNISNKTNN